MRVQVLLSSTLLLLLTVIALSGCKESLVPCYWTDRPLQIDGRFADWEGIPLVQFDDEKATAALCNDGSFLYLLFSVTDPAVARAIRFSGLSVWIDPDGGREQPFMVSYKAGPDRGHARDLAGGSGTGGMPPLPGFQDMMPHDSAMPEELRCFVKNRIVEMIIPTDGSRGPSASFAGDSGSYIYELKIPLKESLVRYYGLGCTPGQTIGITARWGGANHRAMMGSGPDNGGGGFGGISSPGGMGGSSSGMGAPPAGGLSRASSMPKEQEIWFSTTLATAPGEISTTP